MTLEEFKIKQKYLTAYAKYRKNQIKLFVSFLK